jgi:hypothetical protein
MNATDVIKELEKRGGVADKEWHGEKLEMKTNEQRLQEQYEAAEGQEEQEKNVVETGRFEIEVEDSKSKNRNSLNGKEVNVLDALQLQRQRPAASSSVY